MQSVWKSPEMKRRQNKVPKTLLITTVAHIRPIIPNPDDATQTGCR